MGSTGAARVEMHGDATQWCHFSRSGETLVLRQYVNGKPFDVTDKVKGVLEVVPLKMCKQLATSSKGYGYKEMIWTKILRLLESGKRPESKANTDDSGTPRIVPITKLRRFYEMLDLFNVHTRNSLAQFYSEQPQHLEELWKDSFKTFTAYNNTDKWGKEKRQLLPVYMGDLVDIKATNEFASFVESQGIKSDCLGYSYVYRELNPRATRNAVFSDNRPASKSGTGGIDLLLKSDCGYPVVGEVKIKRDEDAFYALIQVLAYGVELSTKNQLKRLAESFTAPFGAIKPDNSSIEVAIVLVNHRPKQADKTKESVIHLIESYSDKWRCEGLAKISMVWNDKGAWRSV